MAHSPRGRPFIRLLLCGIVAGVLLVPAVAGAGVPVTLASGAWPTFGHDARSTRQSSYVGAQTNHLKWNKVTGGATRGSAAIGPDGVVYIASGARTVYALNPSDGSTKWTHALPAAVWSSPTIGSNGYLYLGCYDGKFYALDTADGSEKWSTTVDIFAYNSPVIGADGTVFCATENGVLYALDPLTGSVDWFGDQYASTQGSPSIGSTGTVYTGGGWLSAWNPTTGSVEATFAGVGAFYYDPAIGSTGTLYASSAGTVYAVDPANMTEKWSHPTGTYVWTAPAIASDGTIYVGCEDGTIRALNGTTGQEKWSHATGAGVESCPTLGADGTVYVGNNAGDVLALNPSDGSVKWSYSTGAVVFSSPVIGADGTVYFGSDNGTFYAIGAAQVPTTPQRLGRPIIRRSSLTSSGKIVKSRWVKAAGTVVPPRSPGSYAITIVRERRVGRRWVTQGSGYSARLTASGNSYWASMRFKSTGSWRMRAVHGRGRTQVVSPWSYYTVAKR